MMRTKSADTTQYKRKLMLFFAFISISAALLPIWSSKILYDAITAARQSFVLASDETAAIANYSAVQQYSEHVKKTEKLLSDLKNTVYSPRNLQSTLAEELLKGNLTVENFSVRTLTNKAKTVPNSKGIVWKNFDFAGVSLSGTIEADKLADFMLFLTTRQKLWYISSLEIRPLDSPAPADLVSRFRSVELEITPQGRTFEKDSILSMIAKRTNKNTLSVSLTFSVPIEIEGGTQ